MSLKNDPKELEQRIKELERESEEMKQTVEALSRREDSLLAHFENSMDAFFVTTPDGRIEDANPAACRMFGYTKEELTRIGRSAVVDPDKDELYHASEELAQTGEFRGEVFFKRKDGSSLPVDVSSVVYKDRDGNERASVAVRDVTERKRIYDALLESEERYRLLFENMSEGFALHEIITDDRGRPIDFRIIDMNPACERLAGLSRKDMIGRSVRDIASKSPWIERYGRIALTGKPEYFQEYSRNFKKWIEVFAYQPRPGQCAAIFTDISERKQAEKALKDSKALLSALIRTIPDLVWLKDPQGTYMACNSRFESFFGAEEKDIIGKTDYDFVNKELADFFRRHDKEAIESGGPSKNEEEVVFADDGHHEILETIKTPMYTSDGQLAGVLGIGRDITDRKANEDRLKEVLLRQNEAVRAANVGLWDWDLATNRVSYSTEWKRQIGYDDHEIGDEFEEWESRVHPDDLGSTLEKVKRSIAESRQYHQAEFRFRHKDGSYRWILAQGSVIPDEKGNPVKMIGSHVDITERKKNEDALRESEERFRRALENIPDVVVIYDRDLRIGYINSATTRITGRPETHYIGKRDEEIWPPEVYNGYMPALRESLRTGTLQTVEAELPVFDHEVRYLKITCVPLLDEEGNVREILGITHDFTDLRKAEIERRQLDAAIRQARKMESIGNLAGGIAHDFNNVLSSIIGFTELALDDVEKGSLIEENLQEIYSAGKRARDLVKRILAFARQSEEEIKPIKVAAIIEEVLKLIRSSVPASIEIRQNIESDSLIMGNATQIHQILMNLCTNAAHAMEDEGGILDISLRDITLNGYKKRQLSDLETGDYIEITVADVGTGIASDVIDFIFDPYFTTKAPGEGSGMGLAMVHGIVESYGGKITVESMLSKGTTFKIYLPITAKHGAYSHYESEELIPGTERILFVDDEPSIVKSGSLILKGLGYQVEIMTSSPDALELFRSRPNDFDLVISDMTMPKMNGDKLAEEIIKIRPDVPVILSTGYSKKISDEKALEIGVAAFAYKPMVKADLAKIVRKVLDESRDKTKQ